MEKTRKRKPAKIFPESRSRRLVEMAVKGNHSTQPTFYKQHIKAPCNNGNDNVDDVPIVTEKTPIMSDFDNIHSLETTTETPQDNTTDASHLNETHLTQPTSDKQHEAPCNNLYGKNCSNDVPKVTEETFVIFDDTINCFETTIIETPQDESTDTSNLNDTHLAHPTSLKHREAPCNYGNCYNNDIPILTEETPVIFDNNENCFETIIPC
ncbi:uncharacterized protein LOC120349688 [Nilaparvata lugens]|uniref:uncharacterized protein LOC120349688 n=1 Tax=Nilaparvata lugens TaxID=108931 RepID=UPI00193D8C31|nr:uncharacterized protein LOC120349688 [Nilaparvata lugens]